MLADLCWPGFVQQDLLYENHKCPCVASAKCLCPKTEIYAFSFGNTKMLTCCHTCIRITHTVKTGRLCFVELFEKGSGIHKKRRCFYLCVMSNAFIILMVFKHGWNLLLRSHQLNRGVVWLISHSRMFGNKFVWSSWKNSLLKKCGCSRCQTLWLCWGKFVSLCNFWIFLWNS